MDDVWGFGASVLAAVFLAAGAGKLASPAEAAQLVARMTTQPDRTSRRLVRVVAVVELTAALLLAVPGTRPGGAGAAAVLGAGILAVTLWAARSSDRLGCGCFGSSGTSEIGLLHGLAGGGIVLLSLAVLADGDPSGADAGVGLALTAVGALIVTVLTNWRWATSPWTHLGRG